MDDARKKNDFGRIEDELEKLREKVASIIEEDREARQQLFGERGLAQQVAQMSDRDPRKLEFLARIVAIAAGGGLSLDSQGREKDGLSR